MRIRREWITIEILAVVNAWSRNGLLGTIGHHRICLEETFDSCLDARRVVLVGSRVAQGKAGRSLYAASKAALIALARSWASEVVASGVTVTYAVVSKKPTATTIIAAK